jgi:6-phosphofructokinase 2
MNGAGEGGQASGATPRILTLTVNPALDLACEAEAVRPTHKIRTSHTRYDPGGGGINVARVIHELGGDCEALYTAGGAIGAFLGNLVEACGIRHRAIAVSGQTRICHVVYERASGQEFRFVAEGPTLSRADWGRCLAAIEASEADYLVVSGSLPPGLATDSYVEALRLSDQKGMRVVLDTSGEPLERALAHGGLYLVKPSLGELEHIAGRTLSDTAAQETAALRLVASGAAEVVAVSLGEAGALVASQEGILRRPSVKVRARSAVGAGDSFVGAMVFALARGAPLETALCLALSAGAAAVLASGTQLCRRPDVLRFYAEIVGRPFEA